MSEDNAPANHDHRSPIAEFRDDLISFKDETAHLMELYLARPLLRGISHVIGFFAFVGAGLMLILEAAAVLQLVASLIYSAGLALALGVSALYHRIQWKPRGYHLIRKIDHSMIFVLIASSYTPIILLTQHGVMRVAAISAVWGVTAIAVILRISVKQLPRPVMVGLAVGLGWSAVSLMPGLSAASKAALILVISSGVLYTIGGFVYLFKRPDPLPKIFGFHEIFHACVVVAATLHFIAVWPLVTN